MSLLVVSIVRGSFRVEEALSEALAVCWGPATSVLLYYSEKLTSSLACLLNCSQTMPGMFLGAFSIQDLSSTLSKPFSFFSLSLSQMDFSPLDPIWTHFSVSHFSLLVYPPFHFLPLLAPHVYHISFIWGFFSEVVNLRCFIVTFVCVCHLSSYKNAMSQNIPKIASQDLKIRSEVWTKLYYGSI